MNCLLFFESQRDPERLFEGHTRIRPTSCRALLLCPFAWLLDLPLLSSRLLGGLLRSSNRWRIRAELGVAESSGFVLSFVIIAIAQLDRGLFPL